MDKFLNKISKSIIEKDEYINEVISKAFGLPRMPSLKPKSPKGTAAPDSKKQVGDTIRRGGKEVRITVIHPEKKGWGRFETESLESGEEKISTKKEGELPQKEKKTDLSSEEKQGFKTAIDKLKDKVTEKIQEKLGKKPKVERQPTVERLTQTLSTPKGIEESESLYNLKLWTAGTNYLHEYAQKLKEIPASGPAAERMKQELNSMIENVYSQLDAKKAGITGKAPGASYDEAKNRIKELDSKIIQGQRLTGDEGKEYDKFAKQIMKDDERTNEVLALQNEKSIQEARAIKQEEIKNKLNKGEKLYGTFGEYEVSPIRTTKKEKEEDIQTFLDIRYSGMKGSDVKKNNKQVVTSFTKLNNLDKIIDDKITTNSIKGEVKFPFNVKTIKSLEKHLKLAYGKDAGRYFSIDRGSPGGETIINVKRVAGNNWEIKPLPSKNLGGSINDLQKEYDLDVKSGNRIQYKFEFTPGQFMSNSPSDPGGENFVIYQGDQRSGKGASFGTMMNQALGSADGNIVQFHNFDPTGAYWNDMKNSDPKIIEKMEAKGLIGTNGVASESLKNMDSKTQAKAVGDYVNQFVDSYNSEYVKRDALMGAAQVGHIGKIKDQQIPQAVFNFDEIQQFEDMIINNPEIEDGDRKQMLQKLAGVLSTQKTNGKKRGLTVNIGVQQGFHSDELKRVTKSPNNTLVSLDGNAEISSFGRVRGFQNAINTAAIGSAVTLTTGKPDQLPTTHSPILPGVGSVSALKRR